MTGAVAIPATSRRMSRGAAFVFASSVAAVGCSSSDPGPQTDAATDVVSDMAIYGAPADAADSGVADDTAPTDTGSDDSGGPMPVYGAAPDR